MARGGGALIGTPTTTDGERVPIPAYGDRRRHSGPPPWLRRLLGTGAYVVVLWLLVLPGYPLPTLAKAALGFALAGLVAGRIGGRPGWLAGLLGFAVILVLAFITAALTLGTDWLGPARLLNSATAGGDVAAVGRVRQGLLLGMSGLAVAGCLLSMTGGMAGAEYRRPAPAQQPAPPAH